MVELEQRQVGDVIILELRGVAEFGDSRIIKQKLNEISKTSHLVILDFTNIEYIGSSVLGVLATEVKKFRDLGGDLKLVHLTESLERLFSITRLNDVFSIFPDVDSAIASFSA